MGIKKFIQNLFYRSTDKPENRTDQLFFIGNKRSGTTILAEKICLHPDIYITHETDIIWILYSLYNGIEFSYYSKDEPHSTIVTLEKCKAILDNHEKMTPQECFTQCQTHLMRQGTQWRNPTDKTVCVLGDKKPNQQSEPPVADWVYRHFPHTKYIHIVRHPFDFLNSIPRLLPKYDLGARYGSSKCQDPVKILETWAYFENIVITHKEKGDLLIHTLRFEDFCIQPAQSLEKIWQFTGLDIPEALQKKIDNNDDFGILPKGLHKDSRGSRYSGEISDCVKKMMDVYNYA